MNIFLKSFFVVLILSTWSAATVINVPDDQPTIQEEIDAAKDRDVVLVQPGVYVENIDYRGINIMDRLNTPSSADVQHVIWDGNRISTIHGNHGDFASSHITGNSGLEWPKGSERRAIFQAGIWVGAGKVNGMSEVRTAACEYTTEYVPGSANGESLSGALYQIHKAEIDAFLNNDWSAFSSMTLNLPKTIIDGSNIYTEITETSLPTADFLNWPVEDGAPWVDANDDQSYNPIDGDYPDIIGDMYHWYIMNDLDPSTHTPLWGTPPLGINVSTSLFGFDRSGPIGSTLFVKYRLKNVGTEDLDSLFIAFWSDPDLGDATDDLFGVDTTLNMVYCYNDGDGDNVYGAKPPAVGVVFLQTPTVLSPGDTAFVSGEPQIDRRNLPLHAAVKYKSADPNFMDPNTALEAYRYMNGRAGKTGELIIDPLTGSPTRFTNAGDPVTGEGWVDEIPGDRRLLMSAGPIRLGPGDVQEIVGAVIVSQGESNLQSVARLRADAKFISQIWENYFGYLEPVAEINEISELNNTEKTGDFYLMFQIVANSGWELSDETFWFHYGLGAIIDTLPLVKINYDGAPAYACRVKDFNVEGTSELHYYITLSAKDGTRMFWPFGAPSNVAILTFGPDTTAPLIPELNKLTDVHFKVPFEKKVYGIIEEDRFDFTPVLRWRVGGGSLHTESLIADTLIDPLATFGFQPVWAGSFSRSTLQPQDTVFYWIEARDHSQNENLGVSKIKWFLAQDSLDIGAWETHWEYGNEYVWDLWDGGTISSDGGFGWDRVLSLTLTSVGTMDTCTLLTPLDLRYVQSGGLVFNTVFYFLEDVNFGFLDASTDGEIWETLQVFTGSPAPHRLSISLEDYLSKEQVFIRFRAEKNATGPSIWLIDNIFFHGDPNLVGITEEAPIPKRYFLYPNYPNPFNPITMFRYTIPEFTQVRLTIFDLLGQEITTLVNGREPAGSYSVSWNASAIASGIYFYRLEAGGRVYTRKLAVLK